MKKFIMITLAVLMMCSFAACKEQEEEIYFEGTVIELNDDSAIVEPFEGEDILGSADKISVYLADADDEFAVGDGIRVYYDGTVMESYPAQVVEIKIEKID